MQAPSFGRSSAIAVRIGLSSAKAPRERQSTITLRAERPANLKNSFRPLSVSEHNLSTQPAAPAAAPFPLQEYLFPTIRTLK